MQGRLSSFLSLQLIQPLKKGKKLKSEKGM
jgi:hypothetical protein